MRKEIIGFILGALIFSGITAVSAYTILANDIGYTPKDSTWQVNNVNDALDDLYDKANEKIIFNSFGSSLIAHSQGDGSGTRNATLQLNKGKYIVNVVYSHGGASTTGDNLNIHVKYDSENSGDLICNNNNCKIENLSDYRNVYRSTNYVTGNYRNVITEAYITYYVEILDDNESITFNSISSTLNNKWAQTLDINAIPIN